MQEKLLNQRSSVHGRIAFHLSDQVRFANPPLLNENCNQLSCMHARGAYSLCAKIEVILAS